MPPLVSINTCTYNSARFVMQTIESVLRQTVQDFEMVIVDDGSTDGTPELIERLREPRIKVIRQQHITLRFARSIALAHSEGEYLAFLDSDDLWHPHKLERQLAVAQPLDEPALICADADLIDEHSRVIGRFAEEFQFTAMDLSGTNGYFELLRCGNFVASPTPLIRTAAIRDAGGFNHSYRHVNDFELWLRLARRHRVIYIDERLALYRVHDAQFTRRRMDVTLPEQCALLDPIVRSSSYPLEVRRSLGDNMLGQHRLAVQTLFRQGRLVQAAKAAAGELRYPDRLFDSVRHRLRGTVAGTGLNAGVRGYLYSRDRAARVKIQLLRLRRIPARMRRLLGRPTPMVTPPLASRHVWLDGTSLTSDQTGYFNLLAELIRQLAARGDCALHVVTNRRGRLALRGRLGDATDRIEFHSCGWRSLHWTEVQRMLTGTTANGRIARAVRIAWRWWPRPTGSAITPNTTEVLFWRGRFRWRDSHRIAIVQDMTTRLHPEWHTAPNIREFDEFLRYAQQHAHTMVTVSECSRRDIVERIAVPPNAVSVLPMPIQPEFHHPVFREGWLTLHRIKQPYLLSVGTIEPRKNLRRLVRALEWLRESDALRDYTLVLIGPNGWDSTFHDFVRESDVAGRVVPLGFVPTDHLPSLYHFASVVVQPSLYEGFGIPVMEAMCSSAIVVASHAGALPEVLGPGGVTFDPTDSRAIASALLWAASLSHDEAAAYRRQLRANAEAHLDRLRAHPLLPGLPTPAQAAAVS